MANSIQEVVIAVDPGREKCGVAVVGRPDIIVFRAVVPTETVAATIQGLAAQYETLSLVLGNGTFSRVIQQRLETSQQVGKRLKIISVEEYRTTDMAKARYWRENPPRGWRRILPVTMQVVPVPVDDYAAVILAEKYFKQK
jgi:RNase H-fold protein (predicted Holliday junction resolvase)